ncbi:PKD domain-containing protein [Flavobacterium sp.]|uniref:PKD domain-containing protein n=1 Tax=Flavobacterium sp. TaxID=239 RepID=UPI00286DE9FE|nr:PKD domain-containing protein [Flavobacterium sp.]
MQSNCNVETFNVETSSYKEGRIIVFSDTTKKSYDWKWDFGDGSKIAYLSKVSHAFEKAGNYNVKLIINDNCTIEKLITIIPGKKELDATLYPKFNAPRNIVQGQEVTFQDLTPNAKTWEWRFGDTKGFSVDATSKNPSYVYKTDGNKSVTLVVNGDYNHVKKIDVFVTKAKQVNQVKPDVVVGPIKKRGPKIKGMDEEQLVRGLVGISQDLITFQSFSNYFCKDAMPQVNVNDKKTISLKELDEEIRGEKIKIRKVSIQKDNEQCITFINLNYK